MKWNFECSSSDKRLDNFLTAQGCAEACARIRECQFFIYVKTSKDSWKTERCYWEKASSASCPDDPDGGFSKDAYDFYQLVRTAGNYRLVIMFHTNKQFSISNK